MPPLKLTKAEAKKLGVLPSPRQASGAGVAPAVSAATRPSRRTRRGSLTDAMLEHATLLSAQFITPKHVSKRICRAHINVVLGDRAGDRIPVVAAGIGKGGCRGNCGKTCCKYGG